MPARPRHYVMIKNGKISLGLFFFKFKITTKSKQHRMKAKREYWLAKITTHKKPRTKNKKEKQKAWNEKQKKKKRKA